MPSRKPFRCAERGASLVDYGIVVGLVSVATISAVATLGGQISGSYTQAATAVTDNQTGQPSPSGPPPYTDPFADVDTTGWLIGTNEADTLTTSGEPGVRGLDGDDTITGRGGSGTYEIFIPGRGNDYVDGDWGDDLYRFAAGDGQDTIRDFSNIRDNDAVEFIDATRADVRFERDGNDVLIRRLDTDDTLRITSMTDWTGTYDIETFVFTDTSVGVQTVLDALVANQKAPGATIQATPRAESFFHYAGDPGYRIVDDSGLGVNDVLTFDGIAAEDITFDRDTSEDLIIRLASGEVVTIDGHFSWGERKDMERIIIGGTALAERAIRDKAVTDQIKSSDTWVKGSHYSETYTHTAGDGSYEITEFSGARDDDTMVFVGAAPSDIEFDRDGSEDLLITYGAEKIVIDRFFDASSNYDIENFQFGGTAFDLRAVRDKTVNDQIKSTDSTVKGSHWAETYTHTLGDGSYTIDDLSGWNGEIDRLNVPGVSSGTATFSRSTSSEDMIIALGNGETITIKDQFRADNWKDMEEIAFSDGQVLTHRAIREKMVADMKPSGAVVGTHWAETYTHAAGDGSYTIYDRSGWGGEIDNLVMQDLTQAETHFARSGNNLVITVTANAETITIIDHFTGGYMDLERIDFTDGSLSGTAITDKVAADNP